MKIQKVQYTILFQDGSTDVREGVFLGDTLEPGETVGSATIKERGEIEYPMTQQGVDRAVAHANGF